ncbi:MAG: zinc ribbon domain-containing protein [Spirochaetaceae bacterium]|jgi:RNA polymerase subunit RPABC4/transcription elongation factor Spt4|nr:zinc ribbon domain-containing protein [Spirochaetaceae bacterium]
MKCKNCGTDLYGILRFCPHCGKTLFSSGELRCAKCHEILESYWKFCPMCAEPVRDKDFSKTENKAQNAPFRW